MAVMRPRRSSRTPLPPLRQERAYRAYVSDEQRLQAPVPALTTCRRRESVSLTYADLRAMTNTMRASPGAMATTGKPCPRFATGATAIASSPGPRACCISAARCDCRLWRACEAARLRRCDQPSADPTAHRHRRRNTYRTRSEPAIRCLLSIQKCSAKAASNPSGV